MTDINLIKRESTHVAAKRLRILRIVSLFAALVVVLSSVVLFVATRQASLEPIKQEQNALLQNISLLQERAAKLNFLNDRVRNVESIIKERKNYTGAVSIILENLPSNVSTSSLTLSEEDMLLTVTSSSLASINEFLNTTIAVSEENHLLRDLTIESLTSQERQYILTLKAKLL